MVEKLQIDESTYQTFLMIFVDKILRIYSEQKLEKLLMLNFLLVKMTKQELVVL